MSKSARVAFLGVLAVIALGGWYLSSSHIAPSVTTSSLAPQAAAESSSTAPMTAAVNYTANGFSPDPVTIKQGGTVTFTSIDGSKMWVASNAHPSHTQYAGTTKQEHCPDVKGISFDQCNVGPSYSFVFQKVGSWNYHNHVNADDGGTIIVVQ